MPKPINTDHIDWSKYFYYDPTSATYLRWKVEIRCGNNYQIVKVRPGDIAGKKNGERSTVLLEGRRYKVHRVIWELMVGRIPDGLIVDHMDGNYSNNSVENLRPVRAAINTRNAKKRSDNVSGVTGVSTVSNGRGTYYWAARWQDKDGKFKAKRFNKQMGDDVAFNLACEFRKQMIDELNLSGAGYTTRHGKGE